MKCSFTKHMDDMIDFAAEEDEQYQVEIQRRSNGVTVIYVHVNGITKIRLTVPTDQLGVNEVVFT